MLKSHYALHFEDKVPCQPCKEMGLNLEKKFTPESLVMHKKRFHSTGADHVCEEVGCGLVFRTCAHLRRHEIDQHSVSKETKFMCSICQHFFPSNFQLSTHMDSCEAGRSRTLFRKQLADSLTWLGKGVYTCNFCGQKFHPPRPTTSSLPLARSHVVNVHNQTHLRKTKMSWTQGVEGLNMAKKEARKRKQTQMMKQTVNRKDESHSDAYQESDVETKENLVQP
eukprot:TRINITY_DN16397_c0_g1_i1.p1 TRINITY_DN16397_c0_g1~~TRINITY_DN16397_c0_g1_i1.p1  ORF type:complete len:224 (+),score=43.99 TRINITY_DN16397_c0_g1_i1:137-808(+)